MGLVSYAGPIFLTEDESSAEVVNPLSATACVAVWRVDMRCGASCMLIHQLMHTAHVRGRVRPCGVLCLPPMPSLYALVSKGK